MTNSNELEKLGLVFPGQGSQQLGMGKDFVENFKSSALVFEEASDLCRENFKKICFDGPIEKLTETKVLQPALIATELAILSAYQNEGGTTPDYAAGHSLGEYAALVAAKALDTAAAIRLTNARGAAMQAACPPGFGSMAAVLGLDDELVSMLCADVIAHCEPNQNVLSPANFNAPGQVVIAGHTAAVRTVADTAKSDERYSKAKVIPLQVSAPFHCQLMQPARDLMTPLLEQTSFRELALPVVANCNAEPNQDSRKLALLLAEQITAPVLWTKSMRKLRELGVSRLIEIGPGRVLSTLQKRIDREVEVVNIGTVEDLKKALALTSENRS